ncbi:MAG: hypothetical protein GVY24_08355 [Planctomycetes bacterium]|jgi:hypothetical protein|nr:hypothetical protein [Planctomycetota bacterium]
MPNGNGKREHAEVVPAARGCAVLVSAAACGMVLLMTLVLGIVLLFVNPAVRSSLEAREADLAGLTAFVLGIPWWVTLLVGIAVAGFAVLKELAISHALANFLINGLLLLLLLGFGVMVAIALIGPYVQVI